jgi:hypothetical protein
MLKNCTQILADRQLHFEGDSVRETLWNESAFAIRQNSKSKPNHYVVGTRTPKCQALSGGKGCRSPYEDFVHYTGDQKPWKRGHKAAWPTDPRRFQKYEDVSKISKDVGDIWWYTFLQIKNEQPQYHAWFEQMFPPGYPDNWVHNTTNRGMAYVPGTR